ncbi:MAG: NAD-dependent DNA ligase LigA, partial [Fuerstiella sp.]|nr:NAD-dependent DNA ligase LigA [Fuerstiella sp.]
LVEQLLDSGLIDGIPSLYRLGEQREKLLELERLGEKSIDRLLAGIEASKQQPFWRLLTGLNIRHVGQSNAQVLECACGTGDEIAAQTEESLPAIDDIGPVIAASVYQFFCSNVGGSLLRELKELGLNPGTPVDRSCEIGTNSEKLTGKSLVVTGTLARMSRDEAKQLIRHHGGKASGSVSGKTDYLVAGEKAGS